MILNDYLKRKKIRAKDLAKKLQVDASLISKIRTGKARPSPELADKIAKITGLSFRELLLPRKKAA